MILLLSDRGIMIFLVLYDIEFWVYYYLLSVGYVPCWNLPNGGFGLDLIKNTRVPAIDF